MQLYANFYKRFGLRTPQQLMVPTISKIDWFEFPRSSTFHHYDFDGVKPTPSSTDFILRKINKPIMVNHITELLDTKGNPRKMPVVLTPMIREFHAKNKRFRLSMDPSASIKDPMTLTLFNYGYLNAKFKYVRSFYSDYFKWWNIQKTLWSTLNSAAQGSDRVQFVFFEMPKLLPSVVSLNNFSNAFNQNLLNVFSTKEALLILELWKWMGDDTSRNNCVLAGLDTANMNKVVLVLTDKSQAVYVNLGVLNSWRKSSTDVDDESADQLGGVSKIKLSSADLQKRFLRMCLSLKQRAADEEIIETDIDEPVDTIDEDEEFDVVKRNTEVLQTRSGRLDESVNPNEAFDLDSEFTEDSILETSDKLLSTLDDDLKQIEVIEKKTVVLDEEKEAIDAKKSKELIGQFTKELTIEEHLAKDLDQLAEDGVITAAEYKRLSSSTGMYKSLVSPFNRKKTIAEDVVVTPEDTAVFSTELADIANVPDKSMLKSSLVDYDQKYISKVHRKDMLGMVTNLQKAGIIIQSYDVEHIPQITGDIEIHSIKVKPLQGQSSTIRFNMPVVDEDGNFKINGSKYKLRKQRTEIPIRKTAPSMVALSSYYTKAFVQRSEKRVNNYEMWLCNSITDKGLQNVDKSVTNLKPGSSFDNSLKTPRVYSALSKRFRAFKSNQYQFLFTRKEILEFADEKLLKGIEKNGSIVVGISDDNNLLVMDKNNTIYERVNDELKIIGTIEDIVGLPQSAAPVDFAEIKIAGKYIPLGVVLSYYVGLETLMKMLGVTPRRIPTGQRAQLDAQEWSLVFNDETLVFSKDNKLACMILAGFREYHRSIRNFNVHVFDKRNVYFNILEQNNIGARHIREMDLIDKLFCDPITTEVLKEMGEPQTFRGLLMRSAEMILDDQHPDTTDMNYMRIRGYERFSGAIYSEMLTAIRAFNSKAAKANSRIEMNPYAVWKRITEDPSVSLLDEINPIENLKQTEAVTFAGTGGRIKRAMTKETRVYHPNDMGVISEATKDSSDVSINTYLSANPKLKSLRGLKSQFDIKDDGATSLLSTSALLAPGATNDD